MLSTIGSFLLLLALLAVTTTWAKRWLADCNADEIFLTTTPAPPPALRAIAFYKRQASAANKPVDLVIAGDSIAENWPEQQLKLLINSKARAFNAGMSGDGTQHLLWRLRSGTLDDLDPSTVLVVIGTNNLSEPISACAIAMGIQAVLEEIHGRWKQARITWLEITPRGNAFLFKNDVRNEINAMVRQWAASRDYVHTINMDEKITCHWVLPCENFVHDNLHPSVRGYEVLTSALQGTLSRDKAGSATVGSRRAESPPPQPYVPPPPT
jgi:lysophospholipase L1-like esterase